MLKRLPIALYVVFIMAMLLSFPARCDDWLYTVKPGDNLWTVTERYLPNITYVKKLQIYNSVAEPDIIAPGSILHIPLDWLKSKSSSAHVVVVEGKVIVHDVLLRQDKPLAGGERLNVNDEITTGDNASAVIEFKDGSRVLLQNNTKLILKKMEQYPDSNLIETQMFLERGRVNTEVPEKSKGKSVFKIQTPSASTAVRGTFLRTEADEVQQNMLVEVIRGRVAVIGANAEKQVPAGYGITVEKGQPPSEAVRLLSAPELQNPAVLIDRLSARFVWEKLDGAIKYRVQVFKSHQNPVLVWNNLSDFSQINVPDLPDGQYIMKVRGIDNKGLEGEEAKHRYTMDARPEPPLPASPDENASIETKNLHFRWSALEGVTGYHLQLSKQDNFQSTLIDEVVHKVTHSHQLELQPGLYYWRVASHIAEEEGPFSDRQQFKIIPPAPKALEPQGDDEHLIFRWQKGDSGLQYQIQVAQDAEFTNVVQDKTTTEPRLELDRPTENRLYLRMRSIGKNGFTGHWSSAQHVDPPAQKPWYLLMLLPLLLLLLLL
ncbi:MAG: FecR domain-containing protein [Methylococcales bacterium]